MPSTNKTSFLALNKWNGEDKPKRDDFNSDNILIDNAIKSHHENAAIHLTASEKDILGRCIPVISTYIGDGTLSREIAVGFKPTLVIVIGENGAFNEFSDIAKDTLISAAISTRFNSTRGILITENGFTVWEYPNTTPEGHDVSLNSQNSTFTYIAFR